MPWAVEVHVDGEPCPRNVWRRELEEIPYMVQLALQAR